MLLKFSDTPQPPTALKMPVRGQAGGVEVCQDAPPAGGADGLRRMQRRGAVGLVRHHQQRLVRAGARIVTADEIVCGPQRLLPI